jgi:ABC-type multidrug transport system fused ATPase/permease subunit
VLVLSWLWRVVLWTRFLISTARLDLQLNAAHPDGAAGLGFVGYSVQAFSVLALAFSVIVAGTLANRIIHAGAALHELAYTIGIVIVVLVLLFCAPLLAFSRRLLQTWRAGVYAYGKLAREVGERFEAKWLTARRVEEGALEVPDFSAVTDVYSIVANVYRMRIVPFALISVVVLTAAASAPFVPVALLTVPFDKIVSALAGLVM